MSNGNHYVTAAAMSDRGGTTILCCRCGIIAHGEAPAQTITRLFAAHAEESERAESVWDEIAGT